MIPGITAWRRNSGIPLGFGDFYPISLITEDSVVAITGVDDMTVSNVGQLGFYGQYWQDLTQRQPAANPSGIGGKRTLDFSGALDNTGDYLIAGPGAQAGVQTLPSRSRYGYLVVVYEKGLTDITPINRIIQRFSSGDAGFQIRAGSSAAANTPQFIVLRAGGGVVTLNHSVPLLGPTILLGIFDCINNTVEFWVNGELSATAALSGTSGAWISADSFSSTIGANSIDDTSNFDGKLALAAADIQFLSPEDVDYIFGIAAHRYGLQSVLPNGHPWKVSTPSYQIPTEDPYWATTTLLDFSNGNVDSRGNAWTLVNTPTITAGDSRWTGGSKLTLNGTNQYIVAPTNLELYMDGDFTLEFGWRPEPGSGKQLQSDCFWSYDSNNYWYDAVWAGGAQRIPSELPFGRDVYNDITLVRSSGIFHIFCNGVYTASSTVAYGGAIDFRGCDFGRYRPNNNGYLRGDFGYIRFTKGVARYPATHYSRAKFPFPTA